MLLTVTSFSESCRCSFASLVGEALGQRANRVVLRLLDQLALIGDDMVDGPEQLGLALRTEGKPPPHPGSEFHRRTRLARLAAVVGPAADRFVAWLWMGHRRVTGQNQLP